jgi:CheY-like chemotaxis protein
MIKVLIADKDATFDVALSRHLTKVENIKIVDTTMDGDETLKSYYEYNPDVLILNVEMPKKNGFEILQTLSELGNNEKKRNNVILILNEKVKILPIGLKKIYTTLKKPISPEDILTLILDMNSETDSRFNIEYRKELEQLYREIGFNLCSLGTRCLIELIIMLTQSEISTMNNNQIYEKLSAKLKIPADKIKWNITKSIESAYRYAPKGKFKQVFPDFDEYRKPTPKYMITLTMQKNYEKRTVFLNNEWQKSLKNKRLNIEKTTPLF